MENLLEIKNLTVGFKEENDTKIILQNINLDLKKEETLAIVGESGCGKSLTAMSIINLLPKNSIILNGEILFNNTNLLSLSQNEIQKIRGKKIALIPQDPMSSLNPLFTIENQILEIINFHQNIKGEQAVKIAIEALEKVKIPDIKTKIKNYPHELSGGMRQRVIIAMAIASNAEIIIADEPTTALDVTVQAQIMYLLNDIKKELKTSIIFITHDLALVSENADRIIVMYAGQIMETASSQDIFRNPKHPYTKVLIKTIPSLTSDKLEVIKGQPPNFKETIQGCIFAPRCNYCFDKCTQSEPAFYKQNDNHSVKCWLY